MPEKLTWGDAGEIGYQLYETHEDTNPLSVTFVQMHKWVLALPGFVGDPKASAEKTLEAIQMAWYDEWKMDNE